MKLLRVLAFALMSILLVMTFASCKDKNQNTTPTNTRFDYFAVENYGQYVSIKESAYKNITIELEDKYTVSDSQVDEYIDYILFNYKTAKNNGAKVTNEAIKRGDSAFIFYKGVMLDENGEEKEFDGGSNMSDSAPYELSIGSGSFIDGFEDGLIGVVPSQTGPENMVKLNLQFPENYGSAELAGKDVIFYVYVSWSVQYEIPEYNEKFIKETLKYTAPEGTTDVVATHKAYIRESLENNFESSKKQDIEAAIWENLYKNSLIVNYPASEVEHFYNSYCEDLEDAMTYYNYYYQYGFSSVDVFARWYLGLDENGDWKAVVKEQAYQAVAQTLIYHAIAKQCGIEVTDEDYEKSIQEYIDAYKASGKNYTRENIIEMLGEVAIKEGTLYEKVVSHIKGMAVITYKSVEKSVEATE